MPMANKTGKRPKKVGGAARKAAEGVAQGANGSSAEKPKMRGASKFILGFPESVKPQEIAAKGKEQGFDFDPSYASTVRSSARRRGTWPTSQGISGFSGENSVVAFSKLVRTLGIEKARKVIDVVAELHELGAPAEFMNLVSKLGIPRATDVVAVLETVDIPPTPEAKEDSAEVAG